MNDDCHRRDDDPEPWAALQQTLLRPGAWQGDGAQVEWQPIPHHVGRVQLAFGRQAPVSFSAEGLEQLSRFAAELAAQCRRASHDKDKHDEL